MTQKELLYIEDAIGHENNIIKIIFNMLESVDDEKIANFLKKEEKKHNDIKEYLISKMEESING